MSRPKRRRAAAAVSVSAIATGVFLVHACGDQAAVRESGGDVAVVDARPDRHSRGSQPESHPEDSKSPLEGWTLLSEYDTECGFYYATERKYLPPPVSWEPCSVITNAAKLTDAGPSGPPGLVCERMATPWAVSGQTGSVVYLRSVHVEGGRTYMLLDRVLQPRGGFTMVAEADGPVKTALFSSGRCPTTAFDEARFGHVMQRVQDSPEKDELAGGAIGGSFDSLKPRVYFSKGHRPSNFYSHTYAVGRSVFVEAAVPDRVYSFATGELIATITPTAEDQDLFYSGYRFYEDMLFWVAATAQRSVVKVWTKERGIFTLLDHGNDPTRGVAGFATDGVHMVWMEGRGRTNFNLLVFDSYEHWVAPFSLDKATVNASKRRLRSEPRAAWGHQYAVGCGYAAIDSYAEEPTDWGQSGFRLVRLSDGRSWPILDGSKAQQKELHFGTPLGITCDHVYLQAWSNYAQSEAVRIRIDSLGEGVPAD